MLHVRDTLRAELEFWLKVDGFIDFICALAITCGGAAIVVSVCK